MYDFHLAGYRVERAYLDEFEVVVALGSGVEFRIGGNLFLDVQSGSYEIIPDESVTGPDLEHLPEIEGSTLSSAVVDDDGTLVLDGNSTSAIRVPADREFEAWRAYPSAGHLVVSAPGGELFIWDNL